MFRKLQSYLSTKRILNSGRVLGTALVFLLGALLTLQTAAQDLPAGFDTVLPEGTNRIIVEQDTDVPQGIDAPPEGLYRDAREALEASGFEIAATAPESHVITTEPKEVADDLSVKINLNVIETATGNLIVASAWWAPTRTTMEADWQEAAWTEGRSKKAFAEAISALREIYHVSFYAGVELGVAEKERDTR